jgi:hypothetical protein
MFDYFPIIDYRIPDTAFRVMKRGTLPCQPMYDLRGIAKSPLHTVQVPSDSIYIATHGNYAIPADSSLHPDSLYSPLKRTVMLVQTLAHQFNLVGGDSLEDEQVVLIRRGVEVITLGETWRLTSVIYEKDSTHLYYQPMWHAGLLLVTMVISQPNLRESNLRGDYRVVEAW